MTYRLVRGIDNFNKIIRFDYVDTATNTNEIEFGVTNRFYTRKYGEAVTSESQKRLAGIRRRTTSTPYEETPKSPLRPEDAWRSSSVRTAPDGVAIAESVDPNAKNGTLSIQPYEVFTVTVRGKYFFDEMFGAP